MNSPDIFQPDGVELFLNEALGRNAMYISGSPEKFRHVIDWAAVNHLLAFGGLAYPRLRVIDGDRELHPDDYSMTCRNGYTDLLVGELTALLSRGALLAIGGVDRLDKGISRLCRTLETVLELPVDCELYASWPGGASRSLRWDDHESLLLQVDGCKSWSIYSPTGDCPTNGMQCPEPVGEPKWRGIVTAGDILYIPRGWWYLDDASGDAALYLVVSFINPLGADIVLRMAETLKSKEVIRMDIPRFRTPDHQSRYITNLQQEIIKAITQPSIFRSVLDTIREGAESLVEFNLPWSVRAEPSALSLDCRLVLLARFSLHDSLTRHRGLGWVDIPHNGRLIRFDDRIVAVIERLCRPATTTVRDLLQDCMPLLSETVILEYVVDLMRKGLLLVRRSGEDLDPINQVLPRPGKQEHLLC